MSWCQTTDPFSSVMLKNIVNSKSFFKTILTRFFSNVIKLLKIPCVLVKNESFSDDMGPVKSDKWSQFDAIKVDGVATARCKNSNHEMLNNAERMKSHFNACPEKTGNCSASERASAAKQPRLIQSTLQVSSTGHTKQIEFDAATTKFVVGTNSPFVIVEDAIFRRLVDILRPRTKFPADKG